ncbi:sensor histidine kinase [Microvirga massiliensis]|uniref:sensor histidine kinase n=1 Tax=Microvirga massiliensis TaxID=1033741 RepID=UPI00062B3652|nr:sensor histidine kinase [Microvirga massiliensis]
MTLSADALALLNALPEPALVVTVVGEVNHANRSALSLFDREVLGSDLTALCEDPSGFRLLLRRASGSRQPLPGSLHARPETGLGPFRVNASLIIPAADGVPASLLVRLAPIEDQRFVALTSKVCELNAEVRQRQHTQAVLEETLRERDLLLRELHHRVKNNMQMLAGMLAGAEREASNEEAQRVLGDASRRLVAVGAVQQMLYSSDSLAGVNAHAFVRTIASAILQASGQSARLTVHADSVQLANDMAVPVSLILNELIANALKYGRPPEGEPEIEVRLEFVAGDYVLSVEDRGQGFELGEARKRVSGLGLVRGLVRQLGGALSVEKTPGARVLVRFRDRSRAGGEEATS